MEWESNKNYRIILDNGSHHIRAGLGNSGTPLLQYQNITGIFPYFIITYSPQPQKW